MHPEDMVQALADIYHTGYFTNHGPQAKKLEYALEVRFGARNAVIVSNESLAIVMALAGLGLTGQLAVPQSAPSLLRHSAQVAGMTPKSFGNETVVPSADMFCWYWGEPIGFDVVKPGKGPRRPKLVYVMGKFPISPCAAPLDRCKDIITLGIVGDGGHEPSINCAYILTNDDSLAEKYRNIRSSYGARKIVDVMATANGRVSEFQAGLALKFLERRSAPATS